VLDFYCGVVGLEATGEGDVVHLGIEGTPLLELREAPGAPERSPEEAGLFHVAFLCPDRTVLADRLERIRGSEYELTGASDHNVSEALYLRDPEGNGVELYRDRPREEWPRTEGGDVDIDTRPLDLDDLARAAGHGGADTSPGSDAESGGESHAPPVTIGHVHLESTDLAQAEDFYVDGLGLGVRSRYGEQAAFLAAGGYHHHLGLNTWNGRSEPAGSGRGLAWVEVRVPEAEVLEKVHERLAERGYAIDRGDEHMSAIDPDGVELRLSTA
jgi:catechol 2,3-dioxygenase